MNAFGVRAGSLFGAIRTVRWTTIHSPHLTKDHQLRMVKLGLVYHKQTKFLVSRFIIIQTHHYGEVF